jgi:hypothetical protein
MEKKIIYLNTIVSSPCCLPKEWFTFWGKITNKFKTVRHILDDDKQVESACLVWLQSDMFILSDEVRQYAKIRYEYFLKSKKHRTSKKGNIVIQHKDSSIYIEHNSADIHIH